MLTDGDKMIKTPTYYVFHMMRHHQGAALLEAHSFQNQQQFLLQESCPKELRPEVVVEKDFTAYENTQTGVKVTLPACSVVTLRLSKNIKTAIQNHGE